MSNDEAGFFNSPFLNEQQHTQSGLLRPNPIPLVLISCDNEMLTVLRRARGLGIQRRSYFSSQKLQIVNLVIT